MDIAVGVVDDDTAAVAVVDDDTSAVDLGLVGIDNWSNRIEIEMGYRVVVIEDKDIDFAEMKKKNPWSFRVYLLQL